MKDPVRSKLSPVRFSRQAIIKWLQIESVCPVTGTPLSRSELVRDDKLQTEIQEWKKNVDNSDEKAKRGI
jgi:hypothetical protein